MKNQNDWNNWTNALGVFVFGFIAITALFACGESSEEKARKQIAKEDAAIAEREKTKDVDHAYSMCRQAILTVSGHAKSSIPYFPPKESEEAWQFVWTNEFPLRINNAIGNEIASPGICVVDKNTKQIKLLVINAKKFI